MQRAATPQDSTDWQQASEVRRSFHHVKDVLFRFHAADGVEYGYVEVAKENGTDLFKIQGISLIGYYFNPINRTMGEDIDAFSDSIMRCIQAFLFEGGTLDWARMEVYDGGKVRLIYDGEDADPENEEYMTFKLMGDKL